MKITIGCLIKQEMVSLENWERGLEQINNGTFKYDGSMPKSCINALYKHKVKVYEDVLDYLRTFPEDKVVYDTSSAGYGKIYDTYLKLCNA